MTKRRVVITGMGAVTPCGIGVDKFWNSMLQGKSGVSLIEAIDTERHTVKIAAEIKDKDFNPEDYMDSKDFSLKINNIYFLDDEDEIDFHNGYVFKVISTPFHTDGSVCLLCEKEHALFTGDTLFKDSIGRTDLPRGNSKLINESLSKLLNLDDSLKVYPGHGDETTLKHEKETNSFLLNL